MGSIVSHIYDIEKLYGSFENYLLETERENRPTKLEQFKIPEPGSNELDEASEDTFE